MEGMINTERSQSKMMVGFTTRKVTVKRFVRENGLNKFYMARFIDV